MDVDERCEYDRNPNFGPGEHCRHEFGEFGMGVNVFWFGGVEGRDTAKRKVYGFYRALNDIV